MTYKHKNYFVIKIAGVESARSGPLLTLADARDRRDALIKNDSLVECHYKYQIEEQTITISTEERVVE